jgi:penicillin-binding protein 2
MPKSIFGYLDGRPPSELGDLTVSRGGSNAEAWSEAILPAEAGISPESATDRRPIALFGMIIGGALAILVLRLFWLQIVTGEHNVALADGNRIREQVERAPRGLIYDRNGVLLAQNTASFDVTVVPQRLPKTPEARASEYALVAPLIGMSVNDVKAKAEVTCSKDNSDGCLDSPVPQLVLSELGRNQALVFDQESAHLGGFALDTNPVREYSDGGLLSQILGYTGRVSAEEAKTHLTYGPTDLIGKNGLESQYEDVLRGTNGGQRTEVDATGKPIRVLASVDPVAGSSLVLSIDNGLESHLAAAVQKQMTASGAARGSAVAVDPSTGQVLALVSLPSYDNNLFAKGISQPDYSALLANPGQPLFNKVISGAYPTGSIIKPFGAAAALQEGVISTATIVNDTGKIVVPNQYDPANPATYYGWERTSGLGPVNVIQALAQSSDIFFYEIMGGFTDFLHYLGVDKLAAYYTSFGLGSKTGIDVPGETAGRVPTPAWKKAFSNQAWYTGDTYNISVGQGDLLASPLQMVMALSTIANGGTLYQPHLVSQVKDTSGKITQTISPKVVRQNFISAANLNIVRQGMMAAVTEPQGTACCKIKDDVPVTVAAKTGTAETVTHDTGADAATQSKPDAWFEAFAPATGAPKIAIVVLIEHSGEGAVYAAPAAREALTYYFTEGAGAKP